MPVSEVMPLSGTRAERKRARNRDALVAAARDLFVRQGFEATSIAGIAEAADLGFGTFYRYFPDKESILQSVQEAARAEIDAVLHAPERDLLSPPEALASLTADYARMARRNRGLFFFLWRMTMRNPAEPGALRRPPAPDDLPAILSRAIQRIIERGVASGDFVVSESAHLARLLASAHLYLAAPPADDAALIETLQSFELRGLAAPPSRKAGRTR